MNFSNFEEDFALQAMAVLVPLLIVALLIEYLLSGLVDFRRWRVRDVPTIVVPLAALIAWTGAAAIIFAIALSSRGGVHPLTGLDLSFLSLFAGVLFSLPTVAPSRVIEVAALVLGILAISLTHSAVLGAISALPA